jgi:NADPH:quinone reductase
VSIYAFGLNAAEDHMRKGDWDEYNPISGLEGVGVVEGTSHSFSNQPV